MRQLLNAPDRRTFTGLRDYTIMLLLLEMGLRLGDKPWMIPISAVVGIPMYIRAEAILPIGDALVSKGMGIGSVIALLIGGAGASIPEVVLLSKLFEKK